MRRLDLSLIIVTGMAFFSGCSYFTSPKNLPVIEDKLGESGVRTMATTADRRLVLVSGSGGQQKIIAEPSPDAIQNVASRLNATLSGKTKAQISEVQASLLREEIRQAARMTIRSQGTQYLRDASYRLAEARLNDNIDNVQYEKCFTTILTMTKDLIIKELEGNPMLSTPPADIEIKLPGNGTPTANIQTESGTPTTK